MEGAIQLRVLAPKSKMGFGKHSDLTVQDLLNIEQEDYLVWVYYNSSQIDFREDILDTIGIKDRIAKPGTAPEKWYEWLNSLRAEQKASMTEEEWMHFIVRRRAIERKSALAKHYRAKPYINESKGKMQARNHGKIK